MPADVNKLDNFKNAVFSEAQSKAERIISQAAENAENKRKDAEKDIKDSEQAEFLKIDKDVKARVVREVSSKRLESNRNVLLHRKQLVGRIFENVEQKLDYFRCSEKYQDHLLNCLKACTEKFPNEQGVVYIGKADEKYKDALANASGFEVLVKQSIILGGLIVAYPEINVMLDCTFDSAVDEQRANFCNTAEFAL